MCKVGLPILNSTKAAATSILRTGSAMHGTTQRRKSITSLPDVSLMQAGSPVVGQTGGQFAFGISSGQ
jgi:hypothetical protein